MADGPKTRRKRQVQLPPPVIVTPPPALVVNIPIVEEPTTQVAVVTEEMRRTIIMKLEEYDGDTNNFKILADLEEHEPEFMKSHKTSIPIGESCQAQLPPYLGSDVYAIKGDYYIELLNQQKISARRSDQPEYDRRLQIFREEFGGDRTQEEFAFSYKYFQQSNLYEQYVDYLRGARQWLEDFFESLYVRKAGVKKPSKNLKKPPQNVKAASTKY